MDRKVLACIDHSVYATAVCDYATWASVRLQAPLEFVHVLDRHPEKAPKLDLSGSIGLGAKEALLEDLAAIDEKRSRLSQESGRLLLEGAKQRAKNHGIENAEGRQRHGELVEALRELEEQARLYVIGRRGETAQQASEHLGSNLERAVRALHRPILIVPKEFTAPRSVMIAFDGSATTCKGVEMIARSPIFRGLPCHVVTVTDKPDGAKESLEWARATLSNAGFDVTATTVEGEPETAFLQYIAAHQIDMLVMGAYGHSRIRSMLVGSTTTTMLRTSPVPLLLLR
jgi:nucleotide-binding universal stress UspA family protein